MSITSQPIRRSLTIILAIAALLVGFGAIRAASAWTASAAPLVASPASAKAVEAQLVAEQARSAALEDQLRSLTAQTDEMTSALEAAQARMATDATHADDLAAQLGGRQGPPEGPREGDPGRGGQRGARRRGHDPAVDIECRQRAHRR